MNPLRDVTTAVDRLRDLSESADAAERNGAVLELIARGFYLDYSDAKYAARIALAGAHARHEEAA